ncbi:hypothetical protein E2C01_092522 [Portunus trituberculatus]|uniref:Uncharacterized protein n=1 Tax=Portunus trituberculatus TaxID=210409 RepID=A0A5B7JQS7_PORTR|nr:hypothetical protein [Portunus trituberculatus]
MTIQHIQKEATIPHPVIMQD